MASGVRRECANSRGLYSTRLGVPRWGVVDRTTHGQSIGVLQVTSHEQTWYMHMPHEHDMNMRGSPPSQPPPSPPPTQRAALVATTLAAASEAATMNAASPHAPSYSCAASLPTPSPGCRRRAVSLPAHRATARPRRRQSASNGRSVPAMGVWRPSQKGGMSFMRQMGSGVPQPKGRRQRAAAMGGGASPAMGEMQMGGVPDNGRDADERRPWQ